MSRLRRSICVLLVACSMLVLAPPRAEAFLDPVTIAILTPVALKVAEYMRPYVMRGIASGIAGMGKCGKNLLEFMLLPWGLIQCTLGLPFGGLQSGIGNVVQGGVAPFKFIGNTLLLPVRFMGIDV